MPKARVIYRAIGMRAGGARLNNKGIVFAALGEYEQAPPRYKSASRSIRLGVGGSRH
jgi:hypothetical protein